jgi:hypothetical protein
MSSVLQKGFDSSYASLVLPELPSFLDLEAKALPSCLESRAAMERRIPAGKELGTIVLMILLELTSIRMQLLTANVKSRRKTSSKRSCPPQRKNEILGKLDIVAPSQWHKSVFVRGTYIIDSSTSRSSTS